MNHAYTGCELSAVQSLIPAAPPTVGQLTDSRKQHSPDIRDGGPYLLSGTGLYDGVRRGIQQVRQTRPSSRARHIP